MKIKDTNFINILLFIIFIFSISSCSECSDNTNTNKGIETIDSLVVILNKQLIYTQIIKKDAPFLGNSQGNLYEIKLKQKYLTNTYFFDKYKYTIETGGDVSLIPTSKICEMIDSIKYEKNKKIIDILKKISVKFKVDLKASKLEFGNLQYIFAEIYSIIAIMSDEHQVDIYLKGYADGYLNDWTKTYNEMQIPPAYRFNTILYQPATDKATHPYNPLHYDTISQIYTLDIDGYKNKDLPNLRAKFIEHEFISPFIKKCANNVKKIYILEGYEFTKNNIDEKKRKVQIFIREIK